MRKGWIGENSRRAGMCWVLPRALRQLGPALQCWGSGRVPDLLPAPNLLWHLWVPTWECTNPGEGSSSPCCCRGNQGREGEPGLISSTGRLLIKNSSSPPLPIPRALPSLLLLPKFPLRRARCASLCHRGAARRGGGWRWAQNLTGHWMRSCEVTGWAR